MSQAPTTRFSWTGRNLQGKKVSGATDAADMETLKRALYSQGVLLSACRKMRPAATQIKTRKIPASVITIFLRQCASLIGAGLPLVQALDICIDSTTNLACKHELQRVRDQLGNGSSFFDALRAGQLGKDRLMLNLIHAAEQSGTLDSTMEKLAQDSEKSQQLRARVHKALMYPLAVLVVAVAVTVLLLVKVVPQFAQTFSDLGAELPMLTQMVLQLSDLVSAHIFSTSLTLSTIMLLLATCVRRYKSAQLIKDRLICRLPLAGQIVRHACLARFCHVLGVSIKSGVPVVQALQSSAPATGNLVYEQACQDLAELVNQGQTLSFGIRKASCFPVMIGQLIHAGEQSGTLDQMLENCARRYEQSVDHAVDKLGSLIEPVIMTVLGVIIATLLMAMYLPVFRLGAVL